MSSCIFYGNYGKQVKLMCSATAAGGPYQIIIDRSTLLNNNSSSHLIDLHINTEILLRVSNISFTANINKAAVIYIMIYSKNVTVLILNINLERNFGNAAGGVVFRLVSNENIIIRLSNLNFTSNHLINNGGDIHFMGSFQKSCEIHIKDSYFKNNFGLNHGTVIYSSLTCTTVKAYLIFIDNCIFTHNKGESIVFVGMEHYFLPAFLILNAGFSNNTGTPLKLFNIILVGNGVSRFQNNKADVGAM